MVAWEVETMTPLGGLWCLLLLVVAAGCAGPRPGAGLLDVEAMVQERTGDAVELDALTNPTEASQAELDSLLQGDLTLDGAVRAVLLGNRFLSAALREVDIAEAELVQAKLFPNPVIEAEIRSPNAPYEVGVMQDVVDLLLLPLRKGAASARKHRARLVAAHTVLDHAADVRNAFYSFQAAQEIESMRKTIADAAGASADLALRQQAAGNVSDLALENMQALYDDAKLDLARSREDVIQDGERLGRLMGAPGGRSSWRVTEFLPELPPADEPLEGLESTAVARRLDLAAAGEEVRAAAKGVSLARWSRFPVLSVGVHVEREPERKQTIGPAVEIALPLFDRGQADAAGARARLEQSRDRRAVLDTEIRSEVRAAAARRDAARLRAEYYRDVVLPRRERIVTQTQSEYNFMLVGVFQLIQARRDEINARREYIEARRDYWIARSDLDRAVGGGLR